MLCGVKIKQTKKVHNKEEALYHDITLNGKTGCLKKPHLPLKTDLPSALKRRAPDCKPETTSLMGKKPRGASNRTPQDVQFSDLCSKGTDESLYRNGCLQKGHGKGQSIQGKCKKAFCNGVPSKARFGQAREVIELGAVLQKQTAPKRQVFTPSATEAGRIFPKFENDSYSGMSLSYNDHSSVYTASLASEAFDTTPVDEKLSFGGNSLLNSIATPMNSFYRHIMDNSEPMSSASNVADDTLYGSIESDSNAHFDRQNYLPLPSNNSTRGLADDETSPLSISMKSAVHYTSMATVTEGSDSCHDNWNSRQVPESWLRSAMKSEDISDEKTPVTSDKLFREVTNTKPSSGESTSHSVLGKRGLLSLAVSAENDASITLFVGDAQGMRFCSSQQESIYLEIKLFKKGHPERALVSHNSLPRLASSHTKFDERVKFDLPQPLSDDERVMVSVKTQTSLLSCSRVVGCMSFSVKHLLSKIRKQKKEIDGQYYMLPERLGQCKHIRVATSSPSQQADKENQAPSAEKQSPFLLSQTARDQAIQIVVPKSQSGFGFTVKGAGPVRVGRVKEGSSAFNAGLITGDVIFTINGQDVSQEKSTVVAKIVRNSLAHVAMDIYRPRKELNTSCATPTDSFISQNAPPSPIPEDFIGQLENPYANIPSLYKPLSYFPELTMVAEEKSNIEESRESHGYESDSHVKNQTSLVSEDMLKWNPDISNISRNGQRVTFQLTPKTKEIPVESNIYEEINDEWLESETETSSIWKRLSTVSCDLQESTFYRSLDEITGCETDESIYNMHSPLCHQASVCDMTQSSVTPAELDCLATLMQREAEFVQQMCHGIRVFARPLRHHFLTNRQYQTLFQNMEKLVLLSERIVKQMADMEGDLTVSQIYGEQIHLLCGAYQTYLTGLPSALRLLDQLMDKHDFVRFTKQAPSQQFYHSIETFVERPVQHLLTLVADMKQLLAAHDSPTLLSVFQDLWSVLQKSASDKKKDSTSSLDSGLGQVCHEKASPVADEFESNNNPKNYVSDNIVASKSSHHSLNGSSGYLSMGTTRFGDNTTLHEDVSHHKSFASNIDAQLMDLQERLHFPDGVKPFTVAIPGRHLVYSSAVQMTTKAGETQEATGWLCSDAFFLTAVSSCGTTPLCNLLYLADLIAINFAKDTSCKFDISVLRNRQESTIENVLLCAKSYEDKCAWKSLFQHQTRLVSTAINNY